MTASRFVQSFLAFAMATTTVHAQDRPDPEALRSSLTEMLSLLSLGSVSASDQAVQVTQSGADFRVQLPLNGFAAPANASVEAVAHPAAHGAWDIMSMTFPSAGAIGNSIDQAVSYTIGQQAMHGRLDPKLAMPSTFVAGLGAVVLHSTSGGQDTRQTIGRITLDGTLSAAPDGRLDLLAQDSAASWHAVARDPGGVDSDNEMQRLDGHVSLTGLDRAQGMRLLAAAGLLMDATKSLDQPQNLSLAERHGLRDMLNATAGLLTRVEADERLDGLKFNLGGGNAGTLRRMQLRVKGTVEDQRLTAGLDIDMDEPSLATLSADSAAYLPHHLIVQSVMAGIPAGRLMALLQTAIAPNADPATLQEQAAALLNTPGARAGIEAIVFDAGPLHVRGSARLLPRADGEVGADIHVSATGADALLAQAQHKPSMQGILPMVFLAKGMGRVEGDSIVWDISLGGGPLTINGVPFGQPAVPRR